MFGALGVLGALAGVAVGVVIASLINAGEVHVPVAVQLFLMRDTVSLCIEPRTRIATIVVITFATATAALYLSLRAARRRPVDAMAHFG
jgi:ABC-type lipoprotein release transport system permease subunit